MVSRKVCEDRLASDCIANSKLYQSKARKRTILCISPSLSFVCSLLDRIVFVATFAISRLVYFQTLQYFHIVGCLNRLS